jgi:hypothetical protein
MNNNIISTKQVNNSSLGHSKNNELFTISVDTTDLRRRYENGASPDVITEYVIGCLDLGLQNGVVGFDDDVLSFIFNCIHELVYGFFELDDDDERREYGFAYGFESDLFDMNISLSYCELNIGFLF